ncbi:hypothetical protein EON63_07590 [archaeon]|nr:MAG: hypothetical protein EON63_07590 [archaeon]
MVFATNSSRYVLDKHAKQNYEESNAVFPWILKMNQIPRTRFGQPSWHDIETRMYSRYVFQRELLFRAYAFIRKHDMCSMSAMHIRETDLSLHLQRQSGGRRRGVTRESYMQFVEAAQGLVFLMTDNPSTQQFFLQKYGHEKILVYESMLAPINRLPLLLLNDSLIPRDGGLGDTSAIVRATVDAAKLPEEHRYTTLENTAIDVLIAAHALHFKASPFSSLSELVSMFNRIGRRDRGWCKAQTQAQG